MRRPDGGNAWDVLSKYAGTVEGPEDWSEEHDHYLYGVPKREKERKYYECESRECAAENYPVSGFISPNCVKL